MNSLAKPLPQFPQNRGELYLQAMNLRLRKCFDEALGVLQRLQQLHPGYSRLYEEQGHCYAALNNVPQAIDAFSQAVNINAALPASWQMLHTLYQGMGDEENVARIASRLAALRNLPPEIIQAGSLFADGEFVHADRVLRIYLAQHGEHIEAIRKRVCTREFFETRRGWGVADKDPIFIVGLPRSGSTLIEQILASHSEVEGTQELADIQRIAMTLRGRATDPENPRYPRVLAELGPEDFRKFGERFMADTRIYRHTPRPFFIDKLPDNFRDIGLIHLMLPNAKIIDARRGPMACCFGNLKQLFSSGQEFSYSIGDIAYYYRSYLDLMRHWNEVLPGWVLTVQHEDLVDDLEGNVRRILDFCGLRFEPACMEFYKTERNVRTASSEQVRQPICREGVDQWRNYEPWLGPLKASLGDALSADRSQCL